MQVIVLGMHRSGTSVLARILNLMGLYLGPEGMSTGANPENPKGFWERRDVRFLNDAVLHSVGCDWNRVSRLDLSAVPADMGEAFDEVAKRTVLEMDAHRPWFIKEPRLCLLLPMWRKHLEVPVVVNVYRDPVEVAASMHRRNGIPMEAGLELWEYYVRSAARASEGLPSVNVLHGDLMGNPEVVASRLHAELTDMGLAGVRQATKRELEGFIDAALYRQRRGQEELRRYRGSRQDQLFERLQAGDMFALLQDWPSGWPHLEAYERGLAAVAEPPSPRKVRASGYDAFMLDQRLKSSVRGVERLETRLNARLDQRFAEIERKMGEPREPGPAKQEDVLKAQVEEAVSQRERVERELELRYAELAAAAREVEAAVARERDLDSRLGRVTERAAAAEEELVLLKSRRRKDAARISALEAEVAEQKEQLARHRRERRRLQRTIEEERGAREQLEAELRQFVSSRSWRMTAPMRALISGLRGLRR